MNIALITLDRASIRHCVLLHAEAPGACVILFLIVIIVGIGHGADVRGPRGTPRHGTTAASVRHAG